MQDTDPDFLPKGQKTLVKFGLSNLPESACWQAVGRPVVVGRPEGVGCPTFPICLDVPDFRPVSDVRLLESVGRPTSVGHPVPGGQYYCSGSFFGLVPKTGVNTCPPIFRQSLRAEK